MCSSDLRVGYTRQSWIKNCLAIGLSGGFIEPLEATAIYAIEIAARTFIANFPDKNVNPNLAHRFNDIMRALYEEIRDFVQLHYYTSNRADPFWVAAREEARVSPELLERLALWRCRLPDETDTKHNTLFKFSNYTVVLQAKGYFKDIRFPLEGSLSKEQWKDFGNGLEAHKTQLIRTLPDHYELLTDIRSRVLSA